MSADLTQTGDGGASVHHDVRSYDMQRDGMAQVSGWEVVAEVTFPSGRKTAPVVQALCRDRDTAEEIAELLNAKYASEARRG